MSYMKKIILYCCNAIFCMPGEDRFSQDQYIKHAFREHVTSTTEAPALSNPDPNRPTDPESRHAETLTAAPGLTTAITMNPDHTNSPLPQSHNREDVYSDDGSPIGQIRMLTAEEREAQDIRNLEETNTPVDHNAVEVNVDTSQARAIRTQPIIDDPIFLCCCEYTTTRLVIFSLSMILLGMICIVIIFPWITAGKFADLLWDLWGNFHWLK